MPCDCCNTARSFPEYRMFDPACLYCGARYIQFLGMGVFELPSTTVKALREKVLNDWEAHGHERVEIREIALVKELAVMPVASGESGRRKKTKSLPTGTKL